MKLIIFEDQYDMNVEIVNIDNVTSMENSGSDPDKKMAYFTFKFVDGNSLIIESKEDDIPEEADWHDGPTKLTTDIVEALKSKDAYSYVRYII